MVLPEPVRARPSSVRPASASGRTRAWISKAVVSPARSSAVTSFGGRLSSVNGVGSGDGSAAERWRAVSSSETADWGEFPEER